MSSISEISPINTTPNSTVNVETPLAKTDDKVYSHKVDPCLTEEERRFYEKAYPTVDLVRDRKVHCTVCKTHIGTAPIKENSIKMHPILRVTHCLKCHDFYNSGEFSKGEDGSELYCRWCGQGGEVYCCSSCPYVFCKMCIIKNLSRGVIVDIEQNENWNCFRCAPKILWPLRAQHWALMQYIEQQKKQILSLNLSDTEHKKHMSMDRTKCCRLAKARCGNMSDSSESLDSLTSRRSYNTSNKKKLSNNDLTLLPGAKRIRNNAEVVCTPDLMSMLEPDCQITLPQQKISQRPLPSANVLAQKGLSLKSGFGNSSLSVANNVSGHTRSSVPPPLVLRNTGIKIRPGMPTPIVRRTIIGPRTPTPSGTGTPVYHTINGYRIDLNSAAQQETFRLPNGKLIQVKRQGTLPPSNQPSNSTWQLQQQQQRPQNQSIGAMRQVHITQNSYPSLNVQQTQHRHHNTSAGNTALANHNGVSHMQIINGQLISSGSNAQTTGLSQSANVSNIPLKPLMVRHTFPDTPIGQARSKLQEQVFNAMEICTHLSSKVQILTNANAYKQARNYLEVKELYIHLSYLLTYAIGRFKGLQDKCLNDMRQLGFGSDADCLENGQLAADKQASDDEDNEIEIVEPKTDLITLDSDDDEITTTNNSIPSNDNIENNSKKDINLFAVAQNFLATMLEVDMSDGRYDARQSSPTSTNPFSTTTNIQKKQPRKKTTNTPNPTLIKNKHFMELEKLKYLKYNDPKLKMCCVVKLKKVEEECIISKEELLKIRNKLKIGGHIQAEDELVQGKKACSVNRQTIVLENISSSCDNDNESLNLNLLLQDAVTRDESIEKSRGINHHSYINNQTRDHSSRNKLLNENEPTHSIQFQNGDIRPNKEKEILKVDTQEDDADDLDVDKEIAKVLKSYNLNRPLNNCSKVEKMTIKATATKINESLNLKDTVGRTIEKLIASGIEDVNDNNSNPFSVKEIYRQTATEAT